MDPFSIRTVRLVLDQPGQPDVDDIAAFCGEPLFERYISTPWPYERHHAESFVGEFVPQGWATGDEWTWAIRDSPGEPLLGVIGMRLRSGMIGFWLGAPHRGRRIMSEVVDAVADEVFARTERAEILWECVLGNVASMRVAERCGFSFTGAAPGLVLDRHGRAVISWTATLRRGDDRDPKPGWPI